MRTILSMLVVLMAGTGFGQLYPVQTGPDLADIHARLSESAYVVKGRAVASSAVSRRVLPAPTQVGPNLWKSNFRLDYLTIFTVTVDEVLCRKEDFGFAPAAPAPASGILHIIVPSGEALSTQSRFDPNRHNRREYLLPEREYLLLVREAPGHDMLLETYDLDRGVTYYRTVESQRGAVALPDAANPEKPYAFITPLVQAVTVFCEAVKGPDAATKIRQLQGVRDFFDYPDWRKSVNQAIRAFQVQGKKAER